MLCVLHPGMQVPRRSAMAHWRNLPLQVAVLQALATLCHENEQSRRQLLQASLPMPAQGGTLQQVIKLLDSPDTQVRSGDLELAWVCACIMTGQAWDSHLGDLLPMPKQQNVHCRSPGPWATFQG